MRIITYVIILLLTFTGCSSDTQNSVLNIDEPANITLTPVDLFKGEAKKFRPFVGTMSGAIKLRYDGNKPNAYLSADIWKEGKKVSSACNMGDIFSNIGKSSKYETEVIMSINKISTEDQEDLNEITISLYDDSGSSTITCKVPWDKTLTAHGHIAINEPVTFIAEDSVPIWGMKATSTNEMFSGDFSLQSLSRLEQAIILTLYFDE